MTRSAARTVLLCLSFSLSLPASTAIAQAQSTGLVRVPVPPPRDERVVPLGPAQVTDLAGEASVKEAAPNSSASQWRPLSRGLAVGGSSHVRTAASPASHVELRFSDGSLLRMDRSSEVSIVSQARQIVLHRGRVLISADRMVGGVTILTAERAFVPEGTTYLVDRAPVPSAPGQAPALPTAAGLRLTVLEGVVCACAVAPATVSGPVAPNQAVPRPQPKSSREQILLPGEVWTAQQESAAAPGPAVIDLRALLLTDPLLVAFASPVPSLAKINELANQQRRKILSGRNARLRREIFWKRPPRAPLKLPALFADPNRVTVTYE